MNNINNYRNSVMDNKKKKIKVSNVVNVVKSVNNDDFKVYFE